MDDPGCTRRDFLHGAIRLGGGALVFLSGTSLAAEQHPDERVAWTSTSGRGNAGVVTFHRLDDAKTRPSRVASLRFGIPCQAGDSKKSVDEIRLKAMLSAWAVPIASIARSPARTWP